MMLGVLSQLQKMFNPSVLFSANEQGAWFDPSDLSTLFQDHNGTIPVTTTGQAIGLMLDKRPGLVKGSEINTAGVNGWSAGRSAILTVVGGNLRVAPGGELSPYASKSFPTTAGQWYELIVPIPSGSSATVQSSVRVGDTAGTGSVYSEPLTTGFRTRTVKFIAATVNTVVTLIHTGNTAGDYMEFGAASLKTLPGNHAYQSVAGAKPSYKELNGVRSVAFDGTDDVLLVLDSIGLRGSKMSFCVGMNPLGLKAREDWFSCGSSSTYQTNNYTFGNNASSQFQTLARTPQAVLTSGTIPAANSVLSFKFDNAVTTLYTRINAVAQANITNVTFGTDNTTGLFIGKSSSAGVSDYNLCGLIIREGLVSDITVAQMEKWMGVKTGTTF